MSRRLPPTEPATEPLLLVTVGSDHHPFDRVITWVDRYLETTQRTGMRYVCQHGAARPPRVGEHVPFLEHQVLLDRLGEATVVVCHGGPGALLESLRSGVVPIAVPRERRFGEAVDDHQLAFCRFMAERGEVVLAETEDELHRALEWMLTDPSASVAPPLSYDTEQAAVLERFADIVSACRPTRRGGLLALRRRPSYRAGAS